MNKNRFLVFLFSLIPGAGQMYLGYMRRGICLMALFCAVIALTAIIGLAGLALPVGLVAYLRSWRYRLRLDKDLAAIAENSELIIERIGHLSSNQ